MNANVFQKRVNKAYIELHAKMEKEFTKLVKEQGGKIELSCNVESDTIEVNSIELNEDGKLVFRGTDNRRGEPYDFEIYELTTDEIFDLAMSLA